MPILYNCHTDGDEYRITKFDSLGNVESSYLCSVTECECPAGHRDTCRHRQMLPRFIYEEKLNSFWFFNFDSKTWVLNEPAEKEQDQPPKEVEPARSLPKGIQAYNMEALIPEELHNIIAEAVGEPPFKRRV